MRPVFKVNKITPNIIQQQTTNTSENKTQIQPKIDEYIKKTNNILPQQTSHRNITRLSPIDVKFDQTMNYNKPLRAYEAKTNNTLLTTSAPKNELPKQSYFSGLFQSKFLLLGLSLIPILLFQTSNVSADQITKKMSTARLSV